ncbi:clathrin coat assembly protein ap17 [Mycena belliarum]|uniref:Clathrin coat assembly protein ap17 n=1 Tax=Mycena belliarum TaxID=1033014 RepID=A0AAD6TXY3_9AGAR|nr:clathrin coat assembly protein ap17 [Mycena belliae]
MIRFILVQQNRQGKTRLSKWYVPYKDEEKARYMVHRLVSSRDQKYQSNFVEFRNYKIVYRRYAGLFFCVCFDANDNELAYLEAIHFLVTVLSIWSFSHRKLFTKLRRSTGASRLCMCAS